MPSSPPDRDTIRRIVEEVVRRLVTPPLAAVPTAPPSAAPTARSAPPLLVERVVSVATLQRLPAGTSRIQVERGAVVTPAAREYAAEQAIVIERAAGEAVAVGQPFVVAQAGCRTDVSRQAAAVVRAVPGATRIPSSGLGDVLAAIALHASRDGARGLLLTGRAALAVAAANRSSALRAVTATDVRSLAAAVAEVEANLVVIDPDRFAGGLDRAAADLARRAAAAPPAELAAAPGCGCTSHPHP